MAGSMTVLLSGGAAAVVAASPASASASYIDSVGSATTYNMMTQLFPSTIHNIAPGATSGSIPDDPTCAGGVTFSAGSPAPNGSTAGKAALKAEEPGTSTTSGCYDIARSSSAPSSADGAGFEYYAYALDGVAPLVGSAALANLPANTPAELKLNEVLDIYNCTDTNWDQVQVGGWGSTPIMGADQPIIRYWPQSGSGTLAFYQNMLSSLSSFTDNGTTFDPTTFTTANGCNNDLTGSFISEENDETNIVGDSDQAGAIYIFSAGQYANQWNDSTDFNTSVGNFDPSLTLADVLDLGTLTGQPPGGGSPVYNNDSTTSHPFIDYTDGFDRADSTASIDTTTVTEANEWYHAFGTASLIPGVRYLYNVIDNELPTYATVKGLVGFDNVSGGTISPLCDHQNSAASIISTSGFVPLGDPGSAGYAAPAGSNVAGSFCRFFPGGS